MLGSILQFILMPGMLTGRLLCFGCSLGCSKASEFLCLSWGWCAVYASDELLRNVKIA